MAPIHSLMHDLQRVNRPKLKELVMMPEWIALFISDQVGVGDFMAFDDLSAESFFTFAEFCVVILRYGFE